MTVMQGGWMGDWGTGFMGGANGLGMVLIAIVVVIGVVVLMRNGGTPK